MSFECPLPRRVRLAMLTGLLVGLVVTGAARADLLFLKDGFALQGKIRREGITEFDPVTREPVTIPRGFFLLDDGARRIIFSPSQVRIVERLTTPIDEKIEVGRVVMIVQPRDMSPIVEVVDSTPWDSRWERTLDLRTTSGRIKIPQILAELNPFYFRGDCTARYRWHAAYLTRELTPEVLEKLLDNHAQFKETDDLKPEQILARRMRRVDFYAQAGWFHLAEKELDRVAADQPSQKERVASSRKALAKLKARDRLEEVKRMVQAGRHGAVGKALGEFPEADVPEAILAELREVRTRHTSCAAQLKEAARLLEELGRDPGEPSHKALAEAARTVRAELHPDTVERLDAFLSQARQAERQKAAGKKPERSEAELLALAVSGWLLGSASAEYLPERAVNLWKTRGMVLEYLRTEDAARKKLLADYQRTVTPRVEFDEAAQMIPALPPEEPSKETGTGVQERTVGTGRAAVTYQLTLPPEYTHHRNYPVLIVLHTAGEKALTALERWRESAGEHGYILAAPQWDRGLGGAAYGYTETEHQAVLQTLRDLRRSYRVDSDRVFLFGLGEGGKMAWDVGLGYPDLFAGVIPMGAAPYYYAARGWRNAQYLPFYVVNGTLTGEHSTQLRQHFNSVVPRGYPSLWVAYKGRGLEWFSGEVPNLFDWMRRKSRAFPLHTLGSDGGGGSLGNEFTTLRQETNRFYWLTADKVNPRNTCPINRWNTLVSPALMSASTNPDTNEVFVKMSGVNQVSVWVGRTARGQYTLDLDKPVTVQIGLRVAVNNRKVSPSLEVMLEDLVLRGDRQQLYVARIEAK